MQSTLGDSSGANRALVTWAMFEGIIDIIEAWIYREMPREGWECLCDGSSRVQEAACPHCGTSSGTAARDVLYVYDLLKQIAGFVDSRD